MLRRPNNLAYAGQEETEESMSSCRARPGEEKEKEEEEEEGRIP
jgi:hypothetical protein